MLSERVALSLCLAHIWNIFDLFVHQNFQVNYTLRESNIHSFSQRHPTLTSCSILSKIIYYYIRIRFSQIRYSDWCSLSILIDWYMPAVFVYIHNVHLWMNESELLVRYTHTLNSLNRFFLLVSFCMTYLWRVTNDVGNDVISKKKWKHFHRGQP